MNFNNTVFNNSPQTPASIYILYRKKENKLINTQFSKQCYKQPENYFSDVENQKFDIEKLFADVENQKFDVEKLFVDIENQKFDVEKLFADIEKQKFDVEKSFVDVENQKFDVEKSFKTMSIFYKSKY